MKILTATLLGALTAAVISAAPAGAALAARPT